MKRKEFSYHEAHRQHFYVLLSQKTNNEKQLNALGRLVWGGTSRIIDDFEARLDTSTWALVLMEHAEDASQAKGMLTVALATVFRNCAGFDRRVVRRLFQLDFQILLLGKLQTCAMRKGRLWLAVCCARKTFRQRLAKSKLSSKKELEEAAVTGELDHRVQAVFCGTRQSLGWRFTKYGSIEFQGAPENPESTKPGS